MTTHRKERRAHHECLVDQHRMVFDQRTHGAHNDGMTRWRGSGDIVITMVWYIITTSPPSYIWPPGCCNADVACLIDKRLAGYSTAGLALESCHLQRGLLRLGSEYRSGSHGEQGCRAHAGTRRPRSSTLAERVDTLTRRDERAPSPMRCCRIRQISNHSASF
jgi:hypothetical protein